MARLIVTSALPYANGPIHFGHVVGAYLPADIYVRFRRMLGDEVHFVCGTDEHGVAITLKAEQAGRSYQEYVDHWHQEIHRILTDVGIKFDVFSGTSEARNPFHRPLSQSMFLALKDNGYLLEKTEEQFFSESLQRFLPDRYVEGRCHVCGFENARGDECPRCGSWLDAKQLGSPRCTIDGQTPVLKATTHWYLDLPKIRSEWLQGWFEGKRDQWKVNVRAFVEEALKDLRERPVTRDLPWGVPVPLPGTEGKVLYVWFDAPIGYLSISQQWFASQGRPDDFDRWWKDDSTELHHFIGKDNITFHVVVFPAILYGCHQGWIVPTNVPANEFFNLEGSKFNTSRGWYIDEKRLHGRFPMDAVRYGLTTMMPETADSDWSWREFQARVNADLADNFGNFVSRTLRFVERYLDSTLPPAGPLEPADEAVLREAAVARDEIVAALKGYQFRKAAARLMALGATANRYYDAEQPWVKRRNDPVGCARTLRICAELIRSLAILCAPILPDTSKTLLAALGVATAPRFSDVGGLGLAPTSLKIPSLPILFTKIEDTVVDDELKRLQELKDKAVAGTQASPAPGTDAPTKETAKADGDLAAQIEFEQFAAVDLRAATILSAEKHPKADRLLVLKVSLGFETRTIVAGVASSYSPDQLPGRRIIVVANLAGRSLRGIESQGMVLATDDADGKPRFLTPDAGTPDGARVK